MDFAICCLARRAVASVLSEGYAGGKEGSTEATGAKRPLPGPRLLGATTDPSDAEAIDTRRSSFWSSPSTHQPCNVFSVGCMAALPPKYYWVGDLDKMPQSPPLQGLRVLEFAGLAPGKLDDQLSTALPSDPLRRPLCWPPTRGLWCPCPPTGSCASTSSHFVATATNT